MMIDLMILTLNYVPSRRKVHSWLTEAVEIAKSLKYSSRSVRSLSDKESVNSKKSKDSHESSKKIKDI